jgi:hypothetical protein
VPCGTARRPFPTGRSAVGNGLRAVPVVPSTGPLGTDPEPASIPNRGGVARRPGTFRPPDGILSHPQFAAASRKEAVPSARRWAYKVVPTQPPSPDRGGTAMRPAAALAWVLPVAAGWRNSQAKTLAGLVAAARGVGRASRAARGRHLAGGAPRKHKVRRAWRFCANRRAHVGDARAGVIDRRARRPRAAPLPVALDGVAVRAFHPLMAAAVFGGRAVPLLWASYPRGSRPRARTTGGAAAAAPQVATAPAHRGDRPGRSRLRSGRVGPRLLPDRAALPDPRPTRRRRPPR